MTEDVDPLPEARLLAALSRALGEPARDLRQLAGGASREIWSFETGTGAGTRKLVLRRDPPTAAGPDQARIVEVRTEAEVLLAAARAGVAVPALHGQGDGSDGIGGPYLLMEYLDGETIPRRLLRDERWAKARAGLAGELGRALARVHSIPTDGLGLVDADPVETLRSWHDDFGEPRPAFELVLRWLAEHRPPAVRPGFVHGDFRNGNLMIGPDGLVAVLDWERAHLGDPVQDLGWLCVKAWRFGTSVPVGGFGTRDELLAGYAEVAGWRPADDTLHWWEVYGTLEWAVICRRQAQRHLGGNERSVELAVLGRRVCESEWDALLALGLAEPCRLEDPLDLPDPEHGALERPTTDELLAATAGHLTEEPAGRDERARFHARVAANALKIVRRELRVGAVHQRDHRARLAALGRADDGELAAAIRDGGLDDRWADVVETVRLATLDRLTVANPRYPGQPPS